MVPQEEGRWGAQPICREAVPHRVVRGRLLRDPGLGGLLLGVASLMRWTVMPGDFSTAFMHTPLLDSDEYWVEPPREVVPDKRYVWRLKKALNGLVAASKRFQQYLFRLLRDLGFESCPLLPTLLRSPGPSWWCTWTTRWPAVRQGRRRSSSRRWECTSPRGRGSRCTTRRRRSTWARDSGAPNPGSWRCRKKATSRASGPLRNRRGYMSEAGEVRRRLASRTSRRQTTMRSISGESCTPSTGRSLARYSTSQRGGQT